MYDKVPAFIITLIDDPASVEAAQLCIESIRDTESEVTPFIFPAVDKFNADRVAREHRLEYTYPTGVPRFDNFTGMRLSPYKTKDIRKRVGCAMSHFLLWKYIAHQDPRDLFMILEQDALFTSKFEMEVFEPPQDDFICSLNSPINATRKAVVMDKILKENFAQMVEEYNEDEDPLPVYQEVPWIDDKQIPQGLPGNSAYLITRHAAEKLIMATDAVGLWPNDALMNRQFFPSMLHCAYPYITEVQGNASTTTL